MNLIKSNKNPQMYNLKNVYTIKNIISKFRYIMLFINSIFVVTSNKSKIDTLMQCCWHRKYHPFFTWTSSVKSYGFPFLNEFYAKLPLIFSTGLKSALKVSWQCEMLTFCEISYYFILWKLRIQALACYQQILL